jgi:hypothetical protein
METEIVLVNDRRATRFLCEKKTFKKDRKLNKIESTDRRNRLRESAVFKNDQRIIKILGSEEFIDNAVYHSGCITKYLLRYTPVKSKFQEDDCPEFGVHDYAFKMLIVDIHEDLTVRKQAFLMTQLLQKYIAYLPAAVATTCPIDTSLLKTRLDFPCPRCICTMIESP